jgi:hypothetical protein
MRLLVYSRRPIREPIQLPGQYVNMTWMPHKERFVTCYIDEFPHFGNAITSRVEGNHHVIKSYFCVSTLHLLTLTKRLGLMLANQRMELNAIIGVEGA